VFHDGNPGWRPTGVPTTMRRPPPARPFTVPGRAVMRAEARAGRGVERRSGRVAIRVAG
jgi:hypothetical protein